MRVADGLRKNGYEGEVVLISDEDHPPYDRPPLSKQVLLGEWSPSQTYFHGVDELQRRGVRLVTGQAAVGLEQDALGGSVRMSDGSSLPFDHVVIATGSRPRQLPIPAPRGVHTLRTIEDAGALVEAFAARPQVTIVGGGFIGAEVATAARKQGLDTTIVEALPTPLSRHLGDRVGEACSALYTRNGVTVRTGATLTQILGQDRVEALVLADGTIVPTDLVIVGIGAQPNSEWVEGSGLTVDNGVVCTSTGRAAERVWAVGDVARWFHPLFGQHIRVEHWTHATEQAHHVARAIAGDAPGELTSVPYVWSDQFGVKMHITGRPSPLATLLEVDGDLGSEHFVGLYVEDDAVVGAVAFNDPRASALSRRLIANRADPATALEKLAPRTAVKTFVRS